MIVKRNILNTYSSEVKYGTNLHKTFHQSRPNDPKAFKYRFINIHYFPNFVPKAVYINTHALKLYKSLLSFTLHPLFSWIPTVVAITPFLI